LTRQQGADEYTCTYVSATEQKQSLRLKAD